MPSESEMRLHRACFTGHRPEKLTQSESEIIAGLEREIRKAYADGINVFITGMARGVDIWAAEIVLKLRKEHKDIKLICASPYEGFEKKWSAAWQKRYNDIWKSADLQRFICPRFSMGCFQIRNEWMVNHSARVIAVFNGEKGGTKNTIDYAQGNGIQINNILSVDK